MRRSWCWCGASAIVGVSLASGATVLERTVRHTVEAPGVLRATQVEKIRLDSERDVESHAAYVVPLDENIALERVSARATKPGGEVVAVARDDQDVRQIAAAGELHSSASYHVAPFPRLPVGSVIDQGHEVTKRVYFPAARIVLRGADPVERLRVEIRGAAGLRWALTGPTEGIQVEETAEGLTLTAAALTGIEPTSLAPASTEATLLHYAWGPRTTWSDVGQWYEELVADLPRDAPAVRSRAAGLVPADAPEWTRLASLLAFCQQNVRYVAVEVGIGGFRPATPAETLERQWGDCKAKSFLLLDLLRAAGIEAHAAMILAANDDRIDPRFPTPFAFNHVVVAVPVQDWMSGRELPIAEGYLFVDPTQPGGGAVWLAGATQGQDALIVRGAESRLVRTPIMPTNELRELTVELDARTSGTIPGRAVLRMTGDLALAWARDFRGSAPEVVDGLVRDALDDLFPTAALADVRWEGDAEAELPWVELRSAVQLPALLEGDAARYSFTVPGSRRMPEPRLLDGRTLPIRLLPLVSRQTWTIRMPEEWCVAEDSASDVGHAIGTFRQRIDGEPGVLRVERSVELRQRWVEPDGLAALRELSLAEHRALGRRIRVDCSDANR